MWRHLGVLGALVLLFSAPSEAGPRRVVSLDYCADQFVLALADRGQIAALSRGSRRDDSYYRARAAGLPQTRGTLEEVLALAPDLVVRNWGGPWDAEAAYARFHVPVLQVGDAPNFREARVDVLAVSEALGHPERGAAITSDLDQRLRALAARAPSHAPPVLYLSAGGAVAGRGTMLNAVIEAAGARNSWSGENWSVLPLERMIESPPALLALGFFDHGRSRMNAWSPARHPAVQTMLGQARTVRLPLAAIACEAWFAVDAAETLQAALRADT